MGDKSAPKEEEEMVTSLAYYSALEKVSALEQSLAVSSEGTLETSMVRVMVKQTDAGSELMKERQMVTDSEE